MSIAGLFRLVVAACVAAALFAPAPARAHNGGSQSTPQSDGTFTWTASADLSSPADSSTIPGGPVNVTISSNSTHNVTVTGPANAGFSVSYSFWVANDYSQVGNGKSATNHADNLNMSGVWTEPASRSGTANAVDIGSHHADAFSSVTVAGAFNYGAVSHSHDYQVDP